MGRVSKHELSGFINLLPSLMPSVGLGGPTPFSQSIGSPAFERQTPPPVCPGSGVDVQCPCHLLRM